MADVLGAFRFTVEIDGIMHGFFRECSGLTSEIAVQEAPEGGKVLVAKVPGRIKMSNIVLKWGIADTADLDFLLDWHQSNMEGRIQRKNGSVILRDSTGGDNGGREKVRWNFYNAWPCKVEMPHLNAASDDLAIMSIELAHELVQRQKKG